MKITAYHIDVNDENEYPTPETTRIGKSFNSQETDSTVKEVLSPSKHQENVQQIGDDLATFIAPETQPLANDSYRQQQTDSDLATFIAVEHLASQQERIQLMEEIMHWRSTTRKAAEALQASEHQVSILKKENEAMHQMMIALVGSFKASQVNEGKDMSEEIVDMVDKIETWCLKREQR